MQRGLHRRGRGVCFFPSHSHRDRVGGLKPGKFLGDCYGRKTFYQLAGADSDAGSGA
jgi:hypothetical protein